MRGAYIAGACRSEVAQPFGLQEGDEEDIGRVILCAARLLAFSGLAH